MTEYEALREAWVAGLERHESHRPRLYRGADGIYRCPECEPRAGTLRLAGRAVAEWWQRNRVKRKKR